LNFRFFERVGEPVPRQPPARAVRKHRQEASLFFRTGRLEVWTGKNPAHQNHGSAPSQRSGLRPRAFVSFLVKVFSH
jgi:hypothetical protein